MENMCIFFSGVREIQKTCYAEGARYVWGHWRGKAFTLRSNDACVVTDVRDKLHSTVDCF